MIILVLSILLVIAVGLIVWQGRGLRRAYKDMNDLGYQLTMAKIEYEALDQGMDEQRESYEQEYLSMLELLEQRRLTIETLNEDNYELTRAKDDALEIVQAHMDGCLVDLEEMRQAALRGLSSTE